MSYGSNPFESCAGMDNHQSDKILPEKQSASASTAVNSAPLDLLSRPASHMGIEWAPCHFVMASATIETARLLLSVDRSLLCQTTKPAGLNGLHVMCYSATSYIDRIHPRASAFSTMRPQSHVWERFHDIESCAKLVVSEYPSALTAGFSPMNEDAEDLVAQTGQSCLLLTAGLSLSHSPHNLGFFLDRVKQKIQLGKLDADLSSQWVLTGSHEILLFARE